MVKEIKYLKLHNILKKKIETKEFKIGEKLPSIRKLAQKYSLNNLTISKAYNLLEKEGYIIKKQGAGIFIKSNEAIFYNNPNDSSVFCFNESFKNNKKINFVSGTPEKSLDLFFEIKKATYKIFEIEKNINILNYQPTQGYYKLRNFFKDMFYKKGVDISVKNIQITNGTQQSLDLIIKSLISKTENNVIVGEPTYHGLLNLLKNRCNILAISMEKDGFNMEELKAILKEKRIAFLYMSTNFSCPTGISWSYEKKIELIRLSKKYNFYIIDDDFASDLYFDEKLNFSIKNYDIENKNVIYLKSYSKILMPGLRIGVMILPDSISSKIKTTKFLTDISSSSMDQYILLEILRGTFLEKYLKKLRETYKERYLFFKEKIKKIKEIELVYEVKGGFFIWIKLSKKINPKLFIEQCIKKEILILSGNRFFIKNIEEGYFRISLSETSIEDIQKGIDRIEEIIDKIKRQV